MPTILAIYGYKNMVYGYKIWYDGCMKYVESEKVELKERVKEELVKEIVAFLNTEGGTIFIGVRDDGNVIGVENIDKQLLMIADMITQQIEPNPQELVKPELLFDEGKTIISINVQKGFHPIYCQKKYGYSSNGCSIRIGSSSRAMTEDQIVARYAKKFAVLKDVMVRLPARYGAISFDILSMLLRNRGYHIHPESFEQNYQLKNENGEFNMLAELLSDRNNIPLIVVKFKGKDKSSISERSDYGHCSVISAYQQISNRLKSENICMTDTTVRPRKDTYLYDFDAVNEVLVNALIHNDWNITEPLVCFFEDRLEIISHGGLPGNETKEKFFKGISNPRNAALMRVFHDLDIAEHNGHGIPTVLKAYGESVFDIQEDYVNVVIPFNKDVLDNHGTGSGTLNGTLNGTLSDKEQMVVNELLNNASATYEEMTHKTGISRRTLTRIMTTLQEKGVLERVGSKRDGRWVVLK